MRMIGNLGSEAEARTFSDFLYVKGIKNDIELEKDGSWAVWVHGEDELEPAKELLAAYGKNPHSAEYKQIAKQARELREREEEKEAAAAKRHFEGGRIFRRWEGFVGMGPLTGVLLGISAIVFLLGTGGNNVDFYRHFMISESTRLWFAEVRQGQIWRIITPIFLHYGILHIFFNMLWLRDLGTVVESRQSSGFLALFIFVIGAASNVAQYWMSGPSFGGMSGVVYGLLGYVWMKATYDPRSGYYLHESTVAMMLIWYLLGFTGLLNIANTVHTVGLVGGVLWGYLSAQWSRR